MGLSDGAVYRGLGRPRQAPLIELKAVGASGDLHWYIDGRLQYSVSPERAVSHRLVGKGTQQVLVQDDSGGSDRVEIAVR